jgi:hypothetical protein
MNFNSFLVLVSVSLYTRACGSTEPSGSSGTSPASPASPADAKKDEKKEEKPEGDK